MILSQKTNFSSYSGDYKHKIYSSSLVNLRLSLEATLATNLFENNRLVSGFRIVH